MSYTAAFSVADLPATIIDFIGFILAALAQAGYIVVALIIFSVIVVIVLAAVSEFVRITGFAKEGERPGD